MKKTRNIFITILSFVLLLTMAFTVVGCGGGDGTLTAEDPIIVVSINKSSLDLDTESADYQLTAKVKSDGRVISNPTVVWASSNTDVVTVDANGLVSPVGVGEALITCTYKTAVGTCAIIVGKYYPPEVKVVLKEGAISIPFEDGFQKQIVAEARYSKDNTLVDADDVVIEYVSSDSDIASVDTNGVVTIVGRGECYITVSATVNGVVSSTRFYISVELADTDGGAAPDIDWN